MLSFNHIKFNLEELKSKETHRSEIGNQTEGT